MKCATLAVGYTKDGYWLESDLPATIFWTKVQLSTKSDAIFFDPYSFVPNKFFSNLKRMWTIGFSFYESLTQWCTTILFSGPQPAWDTRRDEEFSETGPNFLNYVQYFQTISNIFYQGSKNFLGGIRPLWLRSWLFSAFFLCFFVSPKWLPETADSKETVNWVFKSSRPLATF